MLTNGNLIEMMRTIGYQYSEKCSIEEWEHLVFMFDENKYLVFSNWEEVADWLHEAYD